MALEPEPDEDEADAIDPGAHIPESLGRPRRARNAPAWVRSNEYNLGEEALGEEALDEEKEQKKKKKNSKSKKKT